MISSSNSSGTGSDSSVRVTVEISEIADDGLEKPRLEPESLSLRLLLKLFECLFGTFLIW